MIFARAYYRNNETRIIDTTNILGFRDVECRRLQLCTQIKDNDDVYIFEGDKVEIYEDRTGDVLYSGIVHYHRLDGAFYLYNEVGDPIWDLPLGKLIGNHITYVVSDWSNK